MYHTKIIKSHLKVQLSDGLITFAISENSSILSEESQQNTCCNCRADYTGNIRSHGMHEKMVARVAFASYDFRNTCAVRHCRNTCISDKRIYLVSLFAEQVHELHEQNAAHGSNHE